MKSLLIFFLLSFFTFGKEVIVDGFGKDIDRTTSFKIAIASAKAEASAYFKTVVKTNFSKSETLEDSKFSGKRIENSTYQTSESQLELISIIYKKTLENHIPEYGITLYETIIKAKFKLLEIEDKKEPVKEIVEERVEPKKEPVKNVQKIVKKKKEFAKVTIDDNCKSFKKYKKYILIFPKRLTKRSSSWYLQFEKGEKFHKKISKYLHEINNYSFEKEHSREIEKFAILIFDGTFFSFAKNGEYIKFYDFPKEYLNISISDKDFYSW